MLNVVEPQTHEMIFLNGLPVTIKKKPIKHINLRIDREGRVNVSAPLRCSMQRIMMFLNEREAWILHHVATVKARLVKGCDVMLQDNRCWYLGVCYPIMRCHSRQSSSIERQDDRIVCFIKPNATEEQVKTLLQRWYRQQMKILLPSLIASWEKTLGVHVNEWGVRSMVSRWGSCNPSKKRIWLNLRLIQKPLVCLEYVLVHELVHLLEPSHNQRFHALMTTFMPDWRLYKKLLNE